MAPFVAATVCGYRPTANYLRRRSLRIEGDGVNEHFALRVNGHDQWLLIRTRDVSNPILLYLHGGPGGAQMPQYRHYQLPWEAHFTVVHWDQRGSGKSYTSRLDPKTMTLEQLVCDALTVIAYLRKRFRRPIIVLGHSWGSMLGVHVMATNPAGVAAYVGVGQVTDMPRSERRQFDFALARAREDNNPTAVSELEQLEPYPSARPGATATVRRWGRFYGFLGSTLDDTARSRSRLMTTPDYGLLDVYRFLKGTLVSSATLGRTLMLDAAAQPINLTQFELPMFWISGARDHFTPADLTDDYFRRITAPDMEHVVFEKCGHYPNEDEPERFLDTLLSLSRRALGRDQGRGDGSVAVPPEDG